MPGNKSTTRASPADCGAPRSGPASSTASTTNPKAVAPQIGSRKKTAQSSRRSSFRSDQVLVDGIRVVVGRSHALNLHQPLHRNFVDKPVELVDVTRAQEDAL